MGRGNDVLLFFLNDAYLWYIAYTWLCLGHMVAAIKRHRVPTVNLKKQYLWTCLGNRDGGATDGQTGGADRTRVESGEPTPNPK